MLTNYEQVLEFHQTFGLEEHHKPQWPSPETFRLRMDLIREEFNEVIKALTEEDLPEIAKELCDLLYVTYGTGISFGIDLDEAFKEVHRSNMSKLDKDGNVLRREDGKVLKSDQYTPANMKAVLSIDDVVVASEKVDFSID